MPFEVENFLCLDFVIQPRLVKRETYRTGIHRLQFPCHLIQQPVSNDCQSFPQKKFIVKGDESINRDEEGSTLIKRVRALQTVGHTSKARGSSSSIK